MKDSKKEDKELNKRGRKKQEKYGLPVDLKKLKEKLVDESLKNDDSCNNPFSNVSYDKALKMFSKDGLTNNIISFISNLVKTSKTLSSEIKNHYPVVKTLVRITKELMLNEVELVNMSIYLDRFGWVNESFPFFYHLQIIGLLTKVHLNSSDIYEVIVNHFVSEYKNLSQFMNTWLFGKNYQSFMVSQREFNKRYKELSYSGNYYCKNDFIDYNFMVDKIMEMSIPYTEYNKINEEYESREINDGKKTKRSKKNVENKNVFDEDSRIKKLSKEFDEQDFAEDEDTLDLLGNKFTQSNRFEDILKSNNVNANKVVFPVSNEQQDFEKEIDHMFNLNNFEKNIIETQKINSHSDNLDFFGLFKKQSQQAHNYGKDFVFDIFNSDQLLHRNSSVRSRNNSKYLNQRISGLLDKKSSIFSSLNFGKNLSIDKSKPTIPDSIKFNNIESYREKKNANGNNFVMNPSLFTLQRGNSKSSHYSSSVKKNDGKGLPDELKFLSPYLLKKESVKSRKGEAETAEITNNLSKKRSRK